MSTSKSVVPAPVHVVPNPKGGWYVEREGAEHHSGHFSTKEEAVARGREIAQHAGAELLIHNLDGTIAQRDSHGRDDPNKPG
jgi:hypothetical protein